MSDATSGWDTEELSDIAEALAEATKPLETVDPDEPLADANSLDETLADATVIGVGEVTHGSRTVYRLKHRLFRYLAEELDYRVFALEANFTATRAVNEYITEGAGTAADALSTEGLHHFWQFEVIREFVEWAREFNDGREPDDQVRVHGLDVNHTVPPAKALESYLQNVDPDLHDELDEEFEYLLESGFTGFRVPEEEQERFVETGQRLSSTLQSRFADNRDQYIADSSERALDRARREAINIGKRAEMVAAGTDEEKPLRPEIRDEAMAENLLWLREHESVDKIAIWAHNVHVNRSQVTDGMWEGMTPLGAFLARRDDVTYRALGVSVAGGTFPYPQPGETNDSGMPSVSYENVTVTEPPESSVPGVLARTGYKYAMVDFNSVPDTAAVGDWFASQPGRHDPGHTPDEPIRLKHTDPRDDFDGLVFVREAQPAQTIDE